MSRLFKNLSDLSQSSENDLSRHNIQQNFEGERVTLTHHLPDGSIKQSCHELFKGDSRQQINALHQIVAGEGGYSGPNGESNLICAVQGLHQHVYSNGETMNQNFIEATNFF